MDNWSMGTMEQSGWRNMNNRSIGTQKYLGWKNMDDIGWGYRNIGFKMEIVKQDIRSQDSRFKEYG